MGDAGINLLVTFDMVTEKNIQEPSQNWIPLNALPVY
jgi:hypothetical protein